MHKTNRLATRLHERSFCGCSDDIAVFKCADAEIGNRLFENSLQTRALDHAFASVKRCRRLPVTRCNHSLDVLALDPESVHEVAQHS